MAGYEPFTEKPTSTNVKDVPLSAEERDFINFLLYQFGHEYLECDEAREWQEELVDKLK